MTTDERVAEPFVGSSAYRTWAPFLAAAAAISAIVGDGGSLLNNVIVVAAIVPFFCWWRWPQTPTVVVVVVVSVVGVVATRNGELEASLFMVSVAATIVGGYEPDRRAFVSGGIMLTATPIVGAGFDNQTSAGIWIMGIVLPLALSRAGRQQLQLTHELATTRAALTDQRVLEERRRIARDVHDWVGHGLAAVLLHVTGARHVLRRDLDAADQALAEAENVGRRSMRELRETLGVLRAATPDGTADKTSVGPLAPVPDMEDLAGDEVWSRFSVTGDVSRIDPVAATSLHRVAEEAFANAGRPAPDATTAAGLDVRDDDVVMTIESFGSIVAATTGERRPRYGIVGMSERMAAVGGVIDVGPPPSGWLVRAAVPIRHAPSERRSAPDDPCGPRRRPGNHPYRRRPHPLAPGRLRGGRRVRRWVRRRRRPARTQRQRRCRRDGSAHAAPRRHRRHPTVTCTRRSSRSHRADDVRRGGSALVGQRGRRRGFVLKDASAADLIAAVRSVAGGGAWFDPGVAPRVLATYRGVVAPARRSSRRAEELTEREHDVLVLMARGATNSEIAEQLFVSEATVKTHVGKVFMKLGARDRAAAIVFAYDHGIVP